MKECNLCGRPTFRRRGFMPANVCRRANCRAVAQRSTELRYAGQSLADAARAIRNGRVVTNSATKAADSVEGSDGN